MQRRPACQNNVRSIKTTGHFQSRKLVPLLRAAMNSQILYRAFFGRRVWPGEYDRFRGAIPSTMLCPLRIMQRPKADKADRSVEGPLSVFEMPR